MELTRRDAVAALSAAGTTALAGCSFGEPDDDAESEQSAGDTDRVDADLRSLVALAEVLYPSAVEVTDEFVETYVLGRSVQDESYREELSAAVEVLDAEAERARGEAFADLAVDERDALLRELGLDETDPDPDGEPAERLRYYLVNELLYALFTTPEGGELIGIENPPGNPGGLQSYKRGPDA